MSFFKRPVVSKNNFSQVGGESGNNEDSAQLSCRLSWAEFDCEINFPRLVAYH